jgi:hypothetical protein
MRRRAFALVGLAVAIGVLGAAAATREARGGETRASAGAWCGSDSAATDRTPDLANTFQWHVTYAVPADAPDRFSQWVDAIVGDHAEIQQWFKGQDPTRELRYDFHDFAGCEAGFGRLDISHVRLSGGGSSYAENTFGQVARELSGGNWDYWDHKRYVVYYDGPTTAPVCGGAGGIHAMLFLSRPGCPFERDGYRRWVAAHETTHVLAEPLPLGTPWVDLPHACSDRVHLCDDTRDIISGAHATDLAGRLLDSGRDDYYGHAGARWDAQDSPFLERVDLAPRPPIVAPVRFSVTSDPDARSANDVPVVLAWTPAVGGAGTIRYRVRRNAAFAIEPGKAAGTDGAAMKPTEALRFRDRGAADETVAYTLYAFDPLGYMARPVSVRFRSASGSSTRTGGCGATPSRRRGSIRGAFARPGGVAGSSSRGDR